MSRSTLFALIALIGCAPKPVPPPPVAVVEAPAPDPLAQRPEIGAPTEFTPPTPEVGTLSNHAALWVVNKPALPLVSVILHVPGGSALDPLGHEGAGWLADRLMTQGAGKLDAKAFAETVERLGIQIDVSTTLDGSQIAVSMKKDQLDAALGLVSDMVLHPHWGVPDFKREQELAVGELTQALQEPATVAARTALSLWYGKMHPWGHPAEGTVKGMAKVTVKDVQRYHTQVWNAAGATFTVAGDITTAEAQTVLEAHLGKAWSATKPAGVTASPVPAWTDRPLYLIDSPGAAQTMFYVEFPGRPQGDARLPALRTGTIALGGTFTSRLNALLREKRGYTYGAKARTLERHGDGSVVVFSRIRTDVTGPAMEDLLGELTSIQLGITEEELGKARGAYKQDQVEAMESCAGVAETFSNYQFGGFGPGQFTMDLVAMRTVTADAVKAEMAAYDWKHALFVLVGDRATIEAAITKAGFPKVEVVEPG